MSKCLVFKPFPVYPSVCDECGKDREGHPEKYADMLPYKEAVWKFMLEYGGPYNFYSGGPDTKGYFNREEILDYLKTCGLDFDKISTPEMENHRMFAGTFTDNDYYICLVTGYIVCNCGEYEDSKFSWEKQDWVVADMSLGEIIWLVVKAGEVE